MASQQSRRNATRQKILNAAADLFLTNGFEKTTIAQVVAHADIVKGTFYQHFQTKMDLLVELGRQEGAERVHELIERVKQGSSALDALQNYYLVMAQWFEKHPNIAEDIMISAIRLHEPNSDQPEYIAHDFTRLMLKIAQQRCDVRADIDINSMSVALGGAITFAVIDWCRNPDIEPLSVRCKTCFQIFLQGVRHSGQQKSQCEPARGY